MGVGCERDVEQMRILLEIGGDNTIDRYTRWDENVTPGVKPTQNEWDLFAFNKIKGGVEEFDHCPFLLLRLTRGRWFGYGISRTN